METVTGFLSPKTYFANLILISATPYAIDGEQQEDGSVIGILGTGGNNFQQSATLNGQ